ncbi:cellulose biosynthesis protein BcsF [Entomohabitans teleogrylli]|uniref:cellulose biosynthesis protein BcsF n=1 Tax=Entomohabitans teleogrylli TaxID=1384589 RepID=UPI00073DB204|nr:cellulose biosynthesis protein BcsF [Entomohabitans teleogrylli]
MNLNDIFQLVILCALIFIPLGYGIRSRLARIKAFIRIHFMKPRYVKSAGVLRRTASARAEQKHD